MRNSPSSSSLSPGLWLTVRSQHQILNTLAVVNVLASPIVHLSSSIKLPSRFLFDYLTKLETNPPLDGPQARAGDMLIKRIAQER